MTKADRTRPTAASDPRRAWSLVIGHWSLVILLSLSGRSEAHPVPKSEYDRNVTVELRPDAVHVLYRVEIDQYTLLQTVGDPANGFPLAKGRVGPKDVGDAY